MKKIILGAAIASLAVSCKKVPEGGNRGVLKMEKGVERYSDDVMSDEATAAFNAADAKRNAEKNAADSAKPAVKMESRTMKDSVNTAVSAVPASPSN